MSETSLEKAQGELAASAKANEQIATNKEVDFLQSDLRKQMSQTIKNMAASIASLQKQNVELKAKLAAAEKDTKAK